MSSHTAIIASVLLAAAIFAVLVFLGMVARAVLYERREAKHTAAGVRAGREADTYTGVLLEPADTTDTTGADDSRWWEYPAPRPPVVEVLTGPGTSTPALARGTGQFNMLPPDPPPPAPAETGEIPIVNQVYGIPPDNGQYVDDLFATHAPPEMLP